MWDGGADDGKPEWLQKSMLEREREKFEMSMDENPDSGDTQGAPLLPFLSSSTPPFSILLPLMSSNI